MRNKFTDAHCSAATCTPSRYSILTCSYAFRNNAAILSGDAPLLIQPGKGTLPGMLQKAGCKTGVVDLDPITISYTKRIGNDPIGTEHPEMLKVLADEQHSQTID